MPATRSLTRNPSTQWERLVENNLTSLVSTSRRATPNIPSTSRTTTLSTKALGNCMSGKPNQYSNLHHTVDVSNSVDRRSHLSNRDHKMSDVKSPSTSSSIDLNIIEYNPHLPLKRSPDTRRRLYRENIEIKGEEDRREAVRASKLFSDTTTALNPLNRNHSTISEQTEINGGGDRTETTKAWHPFPGMTIALDPLRTDDVRENSDEYDVSPIEATAITTALNPLRDDSIFETTDEYDVSPIETTPAKRDLTVDCTPHCTSTKLLYSSSSKQTFGNVKSKRQADEMCDFPDMTTKRPNSPTVAEPLMEVEDTNIHNRHLTASISDVTIQIKETSINQMESNTSNKRSAQKKQFDDNGTRFTKIERRNKSCSDNFKQPVGARETHRRPNAPRTRKKLSGVHTSIKDCRSETKRPFHTPTTRFAEISEDIDMTAGVSSNHTCTHLPQGGDVGDDIQPFPFQVPKCLEERNTMHLLEECSLSSAVPPISNESNIVALVDSVESNRMSFFNKDVSEFGSGCVDAGAGGDFTFQTHFLCEPGKAEGDVSLFNAGYVDKAQIQIPTGLIGQFYRCQQTNLMDGIVGREKDVTSFYIDEHRMKPNFNVLQLQVNIKRTTRTSIPNARSMSASTLRQTIEIEEVDTGDNVSHSAQYDVRSATYKDGVKGLEITKSLIQNDSLLLENNEECTYLTFPNQMSDLSTEKALKRNYLNQNYLDSSRGQDINLEEKQTKFSLSKTCTPYYERQDGEESGTQRTGDSQSLAIMGSTYYEHDKTDSQTASPSDNKCNSTGTCLSQEGPRMHWGKENSAEIIRDQHSENIIKTQYKNAVEYTTPMNFPLFDGKLRLHKSQESPRINRDTENVTEIIRDQYYSEDIKTKDEKVIEDRTPVKLPLFDRKLLLLHKQDFLENKSKPKIPLSKSYNNKWPEESVPGGRKEEFIEQVENTYKCLVEDKISAESLSLHMKPLTILELPENNVKCNQYTRSVFLSSNYFSGMAINTNATDRCQLDSEQHKASEGFSAGNDNRGASQTIEEETHCLTKSISIINGHNHEMAESTLNHRSRTIKQGSSLNLGVGNQATCSPKRTTEANAVPHLGLPHVIQHATGLGSDPQQDMDREIIHRIHSTNHKEAGEKESPFVLITIEEGGHGQLCNDNNKESINAEEISNVCNIPTLRGEVTSTSLHAIETDSVKRTEICWEKDGEEDYRKRDSTRRKELNNHYNWQRPSENDSILSNENDVYQFTVKTVQPEQTYHYFDLGTDKSSHFHTETVDRFTLNSDIENEPGIVKDSLTIPQNVLKSSSNDDLSQSSLECLLEQLIQRGIINKACIIGLNGEVMAYSKNADVSPSDVKVLCDGALGRYDGLMKITLFDDVVYTCIQWDNYTVLVGRATSSVLVSKLGSNSLVAGFAAPTVSGSCMKEITEFAEVLKGRGL